MALSSIEASRRFTTDLLTRFLLFFGSIFPSNSRVEEAGEGRLLGRVVDALITRDDRLVKGEVSVDLKRVELFDASSALEQRENWMLANPS